MQIVVQLPAPARLYWIDDAGGGRRVASVAVALTVAVPRNIPGLGDRQGRAGVVDDPRRRSWPSCACCRPRRSRRAQVVGAVGDGRRVPRAGERPGRRDVGAGRGPGAARRCACTRSASRPCPSSRRVPVPVERSRSRAAGVPGSVIVGRRSGSCCRPGGPRIDGRGRRLADAVGRGRAQVVGAGRRRRPVARERRARAGAGASSRRRAGVGPVLVEHRDHARARAVAGRRAPARRCRRAGAGVR